MAVSIERFTTLFFSFIKKEAVEIITKYDMQKFVIAFDESNSIVSAFFTKGYSVKSYMDNDEMQHGYELVLETGKVIGGNFVLPEYGIRLKLKKTIFLSWIM